MGDKVRDEAAKAIRLWSDAQWLGYPIDVSASQIDISWVQYSRHIRNISERNLVWRRRPYSGKQPTTHAPVSKSDIDPWNEAPLSIATRSKHYSDCADCSGGRCSCFHCRATGQTSCTRCNGTGQERSEKTGNPIQCKVCRTSGKVACPMCDGGYILCQVCSGSAIVETWLEIEESNNSHVELIAENFPDIVKQHPDILNADFGTSEWLGARTLQRSESYSSRLASSVLRECGVPQYSLPTTQRVNAELVEHFEAPISRIKLSSNSKAPEFVLFGITPKIVSAPIKRYRNKAWLMLVVTFSLLFLVFFGASWFSSRDVFYQGRSSQIFSISLAVSSIGGLGLLARYIRGSFSKTTRTVSLSALVAGGVASVLCFTLVGPSIDSARDHFNNADPEDAYSEILAIRRTTPASEELAQLHADVVLQLSAEMPRQEATKLIESLPLDSFSLPRVVERVVSLHAAQIPEELAAGRISTARSELKKLLNDAEKANHREIADSVIEDQLLPILNSSAPEATEVLQVLDDFSKRVSPSMQRAMASAHLKISQKCKGELDCLVTHLTHAGDVHQSQELKAQLQSTRALEFAKLDELLSVEGAKLEQVRSLSEVRHRVSKLKQLFNVEPYQAKIAARKTEITNDLPLLGQHLEVVQEIVGEITERKGTLARVPWDETLFVVEVDDKNITRGAYLAPLTKKTGQLNLERTQEALELLTGKRAKKLRGRRSGFQFLNSRIGSTKIQTGWDGDTLVEVTVGKFEI